MHVPLNPGLFRWMNLDSNSDWNDGVCVECEDRLEDSELVRISSVSEGKPCEIDEHLGSKVEGIDKTLCS